MFEGQHSSFQSLHKQRRMISQLIQLRHVMLLQKGVTATALLAAMRWEGIWMAQRRECQFRHDGDSIPPLFPRIRCQAFRSGENILASTYHFIQERETACSSSTIPHCGIGRAILPVHQTLKFWCSTHCPEWDIVPSAEMKLIWVWARYAWRGLGG